MYVQKRGSDPLELELQILVNCHVGAGKGACVVWKSRPCSVSPSSLSGSICFKQQTVRLLGALIICANVKCLPQWSL